MITIQYDPITKKLSFGRIRREAELAGDKYVVISHPTLDGSLIYLSRRAIEHLRMPDNQRFDTAEEYVHCEHTLLYAGMQSRYYNVWGVGFTVNCEDNWILLGVSTNTKLPKVEAELAAAFSYSALVPLTVVEV